MKRAQRASLLRGSDSAVARWLYQPHWQAQERAADVKPRRDPGVSAARVEPRVSEATAKWWIVVDVKKDWKKVFPFEK